MRTMIVMLVAAGSALAAEPEFPAQVPELDASDPLTRADAYSLEIDAKMNGTDGFFPVGLLGESFDRGCNVAIGGNYVCCGFTPKTKSAELSRRASTASRSGAP